MQDDDNIPNLLEKDAGPRRPEDLVVMPGYGAPRTSASDAGPTSPASNSAPGYRPYERISLEDLVEQHRQAMAARPANVQRLADQLRGLPRAELIQRTRDRVDRILACEWAVAAYQQGCGPSNSCCGFHALLERDALRLALGDEAFAEVTQDLLLQHDDYMKSIPPGGYLAGEEDHDP
ncbi:MAG: hypothetical protein AB7N76_12575 [Planctomycetota bacterium]